MDIVSRERRSDIMLTIRGKNSRPELVLRRLVFGLGFRYRLHGKGLPGSPDLVFASRCKVIFMHGCFWHNHHCRAENQPKTREEYWAARFRKNRLRDAQNLRELRRLRWTALTIWECQLSDEARVVGRLRRFLDKVRHS